VLGYWVSEGKVKTTVVLSRTDVKAKVTHVEQTFPATSSQWRANSSATPFSRRGWIFAIKWDSFRTIAEIEASGVKLYSRNQPRILPPSLASGLQDASSDISFPRKLRDARRDSLL